MVSSYPLNNLQQFFQGACRLECQTNCVNALKAVLTNTAINSIHQITANNVYILVQKNIKNSSTLLPTNYHEH